MNNNIKCRRHWRVGVIGKLGLDASAAATRFAGKEGYAPIATIIAGALVAAAPAAHALPSLSSLPVSPIYMPPTDHPDCPAEWRTYWIAHQSTMRYADIQSFLANTPVACGALRAEVGGRLAQLDDQLRHVRVSKQDLHPAPSPPAVSGNHGASIPPPLVH